MLVDYRYADDPGYFICSDLGPAESSGTTNRLAARPQREGLFAVAVT